MTVGKDGYYTLRGILGYNCKYNFVLSERGIGKSYGTKLFLMRQEGKFMCLYRQQPDMSAAMGTWLDTLYENGYSPDAFEWEGSDKAGWQLKYNGEVKGFFRHLTAVNHIKQEKFPDDLNWIWMDEFIPLVYKKLAGVSSEGDAIRAIVKTVEHDTIRTREERGLKPLRVLLFANPFTWDNPILGYFRIRPMYGIQRVGPDIVCEHVEPLESKPGGKPTVDDFLGDEVNKNRGWMDQVSYIAEKWPKGMRPWISMRFGTDHFMMYRLDGTNKVFVEQTAKHDDRGGVVRMGTLDGIMEDEEVYEYWRYKDVFMGMTYKGQVWYKDINTKFSFINHLY